MNKHWIADNLGWSDHVGGFESEINNIEDFMASKEGTPVKRVSEDVFELEKMLHLPTTDGDDAVPDLE